MKTIAIFLIPVLLLVVVTALVLFSWVNMLTSGLVWAFRSGAGGADMFCNRKKRYICMIIYDNVSMKAIVHVLLLNYITLNLCHNTIAASQHQQLNINLISIYSKMHEFTI